VNLIPASKAQQKAVTKYMKENYDEIKVRVEKGRKADIKAYADSRGESVNAFIGRAIDEIMTRDTSQEATECPISHFEGSLSSEKLNAVQKASKTTGETRTEFVTCAVGIQAQRDKATLKMGINPATGDKLEPDRKGGEQNE